MAVHRQSESPRRDKLAADHQLWAHPFDYTATQDLADRARAEHIAVIRAPSARRASGINVAILAPAALVPPPKAHSSWAFLVTQEGLLAARELSNATLRFSTPDFANPTRG